MQEGYCIWFWHGTVCNLQLIYGTINLVDIPVNTCLISMYTKAFPPRPSKHADREDTRGTKARRR